MCLCGYKNITVYKTGNNYIAECEHGKEICLMYLGWDEMYSFQISDVNISSLKLIKDEKDEINLTLYDNKIKHLHIKEVKFLDISDNPIRSLKTKTSTLDISDTKIKSLKTDASTDFKNCYTNPKYYIKDFSYIHKNTNYQFNVKNMYLKYF